jgi:hypothetical protein
MIVTCLYMDPSYKRWCRHFSDLCYGHFGYVPSIFFQEVSTGEMTVREISVL